MSYQVLKGTDFLGAMRRKLNEREREREREKEKRNIEHKRNMRHGKKKKTTCNA